MSRRPAGPVACVAGDMDLVRALGLAAIPCVVVAPTHSPPCYSRFQQGALSWADAWTEPERLVEILFRFGSSQRNPPVLFYEEDGDLLLISRHRDLLALAFRFVIAEANLVEALVDKAKFQLLADRLGLPVPPARCVRPGDGASIDALDLPYPLIVKPLTRRPTSWAAVGRGGKAVQVNSIAELRNVWGRAATSQMPLMIQSLVPGDETAIESYHVYVDRDHTIVAEFTGRKIRTYPARFGDSTALTITDAEDVAELGRDLVQRSKLTGVAKFDFKRTPDGKLYLLEINPRFTLWHHPAALAGVNIPALVYSDLAGLPRPRVQRARAGVKWCRAWQDVRAAREQRIPFLQWLRWTVACDAKSTIAWDDPLPFLASAMWRGLAKMPLLRVASNA